MKKIIFPLLLTSLIVNPLNAEEVKTIKYNQGCTATYSFDDEEDRYKIFKVECDTEISFYNPDGDNHVDKYCSRGECSERIGRLGEIKDSIEREPTFELLDRLISPNNGVIPNEIMKLEIEQMIKDFEKSISKNTPEIKLDNIGDW